MHPEISHTARGTDILANFALRICGARADWKMESFTEKEIIRIRKLVGDTAQVVCVSSSYSSSLYGDLLTSLQIGAVSGGVDSTVAAKLMQRAIGDRFKAVLIDTGKRRDQ